ncbi:MAG: asparagine synthase (glutamine-hydrolyzing) [Chloroflexi bacterium]|nr:asparagine synthase (glutamine-hydrolyzing) [Chloroflexota bacterium]
MCGISGILNLSGDTLVESDVVRRMSAQIAHRGPDDDGYLSDGPVAFGFRRLSIIDVDGSHQPVHNEDKSVWCMSNGEIYNYVELRQTLESFGHRFYTNGDTETIVHAYEQWGLDFVSHLRGMFAIALWDSRRRKLVLARDRIGKKPLFYSVIDGQIAFASELKALLQWQRLDRTLDMAAIHDYLRFLYIPAPRSIFKHVSKLLPGHMLVADANTAECEVRRYWKFEVSPDGQSTEKQIVDGLRERMEESVRIRLRSDVPLGAFLSGGLDSSAIAALMSREPSFGSPLTFSMGFQDAAFDETHFARLVAQQIGSDHHEEVVEPITPELLQKIVWHLDEPFADSSAIPTYLLCQAARRHVTVALSGDGADELFAGYHHYQTFRKILWFDRIPEEVRRIMRAGMKAGVLGLASNAPAWAERLRQGEKALSISLLPRAERVHVLRQYFDIQSLDTLLNPEFRQTLNGHRLEDELMPALNGTSSSDIIEAFLYMDLVVGLPGDMLVKIDRMSMAHGLEVRCPFLDQEVVSFAARIPSELKLRKGEGKYVLKQAMADIVPDEILTRQKQGFGVPFGSWLATTFRDLVEDCLSPESVERRGLFEVSEVVRLRDLALGLDKGKRDPMLSEYQLWHRIWAVLMLELWCRQFLSESAVCEYERAASL